MRRFLLAMLLLHASACRSEPAAESSDAATQSCDAGQVCCCQIDLLVAPTCREGIPICPENYHQYTASECSAFCQLPGSFPDTGSVAIDSTTDAAGDASGDAAGDDGAPDVTPCPLEIEGGTCPYYGYASTCRVPCMVPSSCTFNTRLRWTGGGYCCGSGLDLFDGCKCVGGEAVCKNGMVEAGPPTTYCEFCNPDTGSGG